MRKKYWNSIKDISLKNQPYNFTNSIFYEEIHSF